MGRQLPIDPVQFIAAITECCTAHHLHNITDQETRQDGLVPYASHSIFAALFLVHDVDLPWEVRQHGFWVLLLHDVLEDTDYPLGVDTVDPRVLDDVREMTVEDWRAERQDALLRAPRIILYKLVDKLVTIMERHVLEEHKRREWLSFTSELCDAVEMHFGRCRTVVIARAVLAATPTL